jgi:hypothetical protein
VEPLATIVEAVGSTELRMEVVSYVQEAGRDDGRRRAVIAVFLESCSLINFIWLLRCIMSSPSRNPDLYIQLRPRTACSSSYNYTLKYNKYFI